MSWTGIAKALGGVASVAWAGLAIYLVWLLRNSLVQALNRVSGVEAWGVKFALTGGRQGLEDAVAMAEKNKRWPVEGTDQERQRALERADRRRRVYEGAEILWVDDQPSGNRYESRMLRSFGALITFACTTDEALGAIRDANTDSRPFDLVLSDISRDIPTVNRRAGIDMLTAFRNEGIVLPVIFYIGNPKPGAAVPAGAFGITNRPDVLLTMVGEALTRMGRG
jgi:CheY-like chemotaxis protein